MHGEPKRPDPTPEGALIAAAQRRSGLSQKQAAKKAGMSESRWRQIVTGYQSVRGTYVPERNVAAETIARMAHAVRVTPAQLDDAGRSDAAEVLRAIIATEEQDIAHAVIVAALRNRTPEQREQIIRGVQEELGGEEEEGDSRRQAQ